MCEQTALVITRNAPISNRAGWCSRTRSDKRTALRPHVRSSTGIGERVCTESSCTIWILAWIRKRETSADVKRTSFLQNWRSCQLHRINDYTPYLLSYLLSTASWFGWISYERQPPEFFDYCSCYLVGEAFGATIWSKNISWNSGFFFNCHPHELSRLYQPIRELGFALSESGWSNGSVWIEHP